MRKTAVALALAASIFIVAGCTTTPTAPPALDLPAGTGADPALERWWTSFNDPTLTAFVDEALANNLDLRAAIARIDLARAQVKLAQKDLYPSVDLGVGASRARSSEVGSFPLFGAPATNNDFRVELNASYEVDLWSKFRTATRAAQDDLLASRYAWETVRTVVAADVARTYFQLLAADAQLDLLSDTLKTRNETVELQRDRYQGGVIGDYDLAQAEAVLDIIQARTETGVELAVNQASGELSQWVHELRECLLDILVQVEAAIDFPEEEIEFLQHSELIRKIDSLRSKIEEIIATYDWGRILRDGARVCICGRPNVGKSSLLNALLGEQRVIVTPVPGTTRDVIEEAINLDGLPVVLWDTAGIRMTEDQVEKLGVELSLAHVEKSDAAIVVLDGSEKITEDDLQCLGSTKGKKRLIVLNKNDLPLAVDAGELGEAVSGAVLFRVSAKNGKGLDELKQSLRELLLNKEVEAPVVLTNLRHRAALAASNSALSDAASSLQGGHAPELVAVNLQEAKERLEDIIGKMTNDNILERIFSNYCIGK